MIIIRAKNQEIINLKFLQDSDLDLIWCSNLLLYKVVQRFGVTCLFTGQYDTDLLWHITEVIYILNMQYQSLICNEHLVC